MTPQTRTTRETKVELDVRPGPGEPRVRLAWEAAGGLDEPVEPALAIHLFTALLRYARLEGTLDAKGDLAHHVIEDAAIVLGRRVRELASGDVARFGDRAVPMDDALAMAVIDLGGRAHYHSNLGATSRLWDHVLRSVAFEAAATLHVNVLDGTDPHHVVEAACKATGMAIRDALAPAGRIESTKGREHTKRPARAPAKVAGRRGKAGRR